MVPEDVERHRLERSPRRAGGSDPVGCVRLVLDAAITRRRLDLEVRGGAILGEARDRSGGKHGPPNSCRVVRRDVSRRGAASGAAYAYPAVLVERHLKRRGTLTCRLDAAAAAATLAASSEGLVKAQRRNVMCARHQHCFRGPVRLLLSPREFWDKTARHCVRTGLVHGTGALALTTGDQKNFNCPLARH